MNGIHEVTGSTPVWSTNFLWYFRVTWVTVYSEHLGNTFGPNGFSAVGSSLQVSSLK